MGSTLQQHNIRRPDSTKIGRNLPIATGRLTAARKEIVVILDKKPTAMNGIPIKIPLD